VWGWVWWGWGGGGGGELTAALLFFGMVTLSTTVCQRSIGMIGSCLTRAIPAEACTLYVSEKTTGWSPVCEQVHAYMYMHIKSA